MWLQLHEEIFNLLPLNQHLYHCLPEQIKKVVLAGKFVTTVLMFYITSYLLVRTINSKTCDASTLDDLYRMHVLSVVFLSLFQIQN